MNGEERLYCLHKFDFFCGTLTGISIGWDFKFAPKGTIISFEGRTYISQVSEKSAHQIFGLKKYERCEKF